MNTAYASNAVGDVAGGTATELAKLIQLVISKIPLWIAAFVVIILSVIVAKIARNMVENKLAESGIEEEHKEVQILGGRIAYTAVLTIGITVGLKIGGIDLTAIIAAAAFGIGFALKDLIMNFLAGVMILVGRQFSLGDFIKVGNTMGKVVEIQSRTTILQATDGTKVIVPNSELFKKQVISFTSNPFRRIEVVVGVDYRTNLKNALKICDQVLKDTKGVLIEPKPAVLVGDFSDNSIKLKLRAWVGSRSGWVKVKSRLVKNIKKEFDEHGIIIPWPMRTVVQDKDQTFNEKEFVEPKEETQKEAPAPVPTQTPEAAGYAGVPQNRAGATVPVKVDEGEQPLRPLDEQR